MASLHPITVLLFVLASLARDGSCTYSLFLSQQPQEYDYEPHQQQVQQQPVSVPHYWPDSGQDYDDEPAYRYQQTYQSTYRQQVQGVPSYPNTAYQQLPPAGLPSYQAGGDGRMAVYQLVTIGPELPVLVRLPNQQTAILPVRTVYSLPGFLERIVQRVQNYYSVYNPLDSLKVPKKNITELGEDVVTISTTTSSDRPSDTSATPANQAEQSTKVSEVTQAQEVTTEQATEAESSTTESSSDNSLENTTKE